MKATSKGPSRHLRPAVRRPPARPAVFLTRNEWLIIKDWLEHGRCFEADSQEDVEEFQWPEVSGPLLVKMNKALRRGRNVVITPNVIEGDQ